MVTNTRAKGPTRPHLNLFMLETRQSRPSALSLQHWTNWPLIGLDFSITAEGCPVPPSPNRSLCVSQGFLLAFLSKSPVGILPQVPLCHPFQHVPHPSLAKIEIPEVGVGSTFRRDFQVSGMEEKQDKVFLAPLKGKFLGSGLEFYFSLLPLWDLSGCLRSTPILFP